MKKIYTILSVLAMTLVSISCTNELDEENTGVAYLKLGFETNSTTLTRAYNPEQIAVSIINTVTGETVASTNDFENDTELNSTKNAQGYFIIPTGKYKVVAESYDWDGNSGIDKPYYYGEKEVNIEKAKHYYSANITLTLANVKVSVEFSDEFKQMYSSATSTIKSMLSGISPQTFDIDDENKFAYFPVGDLTAILAYSGGPQVTWPITGVQARQHIVLKYYVNMGYMDGDSISVMVDPSTNTWTYKIKIPCLTNIKTEITAKPANAWSTFAYLCGEATSKSTSYKPEKVTLQWKLVSQDEWTTVSNDQLTRDGDKFYYTLKNLNPADDYVYRMVYDNGDQTNHEEFTSAEVNFQTEAQTALYNGGFENWHKSGNVWYPNEEGIPNVTPTTGNISEAGSTSFYWTSSNPGSTSMGDNYTVTSSTTSPVHSGTYAAKLASTYVVIKFAAASMFTGIFNHLVTTKGAVLDWGVPFTSRPTSLKGYMQYAPGSVNYTGKNLPSDAPAKGDPDVCQIFCALTTEAIQINNTDLSTIPNWQTDNRVVAYGSLPASQCVNSNGQWKEFNIPLEYHNLTTKPTHLIIVCSASKFGDYYHGSNSSVLYLDDFELVYGDNPTVQQ